MYVCVCVWGVDNVNMYVQYVTKLRYYSIYMVRICMYTQVYKFGTRQTKRRPYYKEAKWIAGLFKREVVLH